MTQRSKTDFETKKSKKTYLETKAEANLICVHVKHNKLRVFLLEW